MNIYEQLIATGRYADAEGSLSMAGAIGPKSIKIAEFEYISNLIGTRGLKRGFEIATDFGVSALAAGLGFKKTGGRIVTMDSYVEEKIRSDSAYRTMDKTLYPEAEGLRSTQFLISQFSLEGVVIPKVGWSPDDVEKVLLEEFPDLHRNGLDFVFIDGGHFTESVMRDMRVVSPFVRRGSCVLLHDVAEGVFGAGFPKKVMGVFGKEYTVVVPYPIGFNLALIEL